MPSTIEPKTEPNHASPISPTPSTQQQQQPQTHQQQQQQQQQQEQQRSHIQQSPQGQLPLNQQPGNDAMLGEMMSMLRELLSHVQVGHTMPAARRGGRQLRRQPHV